MTGSLTVRENLMFSASLRLPSSTTHAQRKERVNKVIQELGLERCAEQKVLLVTVEMYTYTVPAKLLVCR